MLPDSDGIASDKNDWLTHKEAKRHRECCLTFQSEFDIPNTMGLYAETWSVNPFYSEHKN